MKYMLNEWLEPSHSHIVQFNVYHQYYIKILKHDNTAINIVKKHYLNFVFIRTQASLYRTRESTEYTVLTHISVWVKTKINILYPDANLTSII